MALRKFNAPDEGGIEVLWEETLLAIARGVQQLQTWVNNTFVKSVNGKSGSSITLNKSDIGLNKVQNTADAEKHVAEAVYANNAGMFDGKQSSEFMLKTEHEEFELVIADSLNDLNNRKPDKPTVVVSVAPADESYTYNILQGGAVVGSISFAGLVQEGLIEGGGVEVDPAGQEPGTYIYLTLNNEEHTKIYIKADTLIKQYVGYVGTTITTDVDGSTITAEVNGNSIGSDELTQEVNNAIAQGGTALDAINNASTGLATKAAANSVGYDLDFDATTSKVYLKNVHGTRIGNGVEISIDSYEQGESVVFTYNTETKKTTISVAKALRDQVEGNASDISDIKNQIGDYTLGQNVYSTSKLTDTTYTFAGSEENKSDGFNVTDSNGNTASVGIEVTKVNGHTVEENVPAGAVFTDTHITNEGGTGITVSGAYGKVISLSTATQTTLSNADTDHTNLGGHKVGKDVPTDAVFTDTHDTNVAGTGIAVSGTRGSTISLDSDTQTAVANSKTDHTNLGGHSVKTDVPENAVFTDTKVTSVANHYAPSADASSKINPNEAEYIRNANTDMAFVGALYRDQRGHVTGGDTFAIQAFTADEIRAIIARVTARLAAEQNG